MANSLTGGYGLRPIGITGSGYNTTGTTMYEIASNYTTAIYQGDLVEPLASGNIQKHGANTSDAVVGVFNGCFYTDPTTQKPTWKNYYPGSVTASDITAFIVDDPDAVFLVDADEAFTRADLFKNYSVTNTTGVTQTGISKAQLDVSVSGTATTFAVQAIDISQDPDNSDTANANANVLVRLNNHFYKSGTTGLA